ncbi:MAG: serine hydrolase [Acidobacteria bacterium]|nr:serine hydrolase [Acidobacteriota bacterium]MCW5948969.1 serine hydrolase [Pyrinomonadaceae bacterium]
MRCEPISNLLRERIEAGDIPSAVYLVAENGKPVLSDALGSAVVDPERIPASLDTIYDLASVTKPLVTSLLLAILIEQGRLDIETRLGDIPGFADIGAAADPTIGQLVSHTSGLPAWLPFYLLQDRSSGMSARGSVLDVVGRLDLAYVPGTQVTYSDINFLLLGFAIENVTGMTLDAAADTMIFGPLGLTAALFAPGPELRPQIAATEKGNVYEKKMCEEMGYFRVAGDPRDRQLALEAGENVFAYEWREHQIWGEVHDGNAHFLNGVAGHAGLFANAQDVLRLATQFLPGSELLRRTETFGSFTTDITPGLNEHRSFGFQLASTIDSAAGPDLPHAFGHLGFTGTSVWIDPEPKRVFILLTNRTHHHSLPFANINGLRRAFHSLAAAEL